jgi:hypothetical protein
MDLQASASTNTNQNKASQGSGLLKKLEMALLYLCVLVTAVAVFIPLNPKMPAIGLDASWEFAMNVAVAQHLRFGKDIVFTYGPYASVGSWSYNPATDHRMMVGSVFVGISYITALFFLTSRKNRILMLSILLFLAMFGGPELLLLSYGFLLVICVLKQYEDLGSDDLARLGWGTKVATVLLWSTLGLLPLVKGSLLMPYAASISVPAALLAFRGRRKEAAALVLIPIASSTILWVLAGQSIFDIPAYLRTTAELTSGYTEAMATAWLILPSALGDAAVIIFLALAALFCLSAIRLVRFGVAPKAALLILIAVYLLVVFKHGFVKADGIRSAYVSLGALVLITCMLFTSRLLVSVATATVVLAGMTSVMGDTVLAREVHSKFGSGLTWTGKHRVDIFKYCARRAAGAYVRTTVGSAEETYTRAWEGVRLRMGLDGGLSGQFTRSIRRIQTAYPIPALGGKADLYSYEQSALLVSGNQWDPRPVIQSYSAYTPDLIAMNEDHLRAPGAPDWVIVDLESIDGRLPSLDDGESWPAMFDNYSFISFNGKFVLLHRKRQVQSMSSFTSIQTLTSKTGETVQLPNDAGVLFAEVELKPTFVGRVATELFNPPQLEISIRLKNGSTKRYRVVSEMMSTGFIVSPLVTNTADFATVAAGSSALTQGESVQGISIAPTYGGSIFWSNSYKVTLKRYVPN